MGLCHFIYWLAPPGAEAEVTVWICGTLDQIRIYPDKRACDFSISEVTLLLPESESAPNQKPATGATESGLQP